MPWNFFWSPRSRPLHACSLAQLLPLMAYALSPSRHPAPLDLDKQNYTETFFSRRIQQQEAPFPGRCLFADETSNDEEVDRVLVPRARRYGPGATYTASPRPKQDVTSIALEGGLSPSIAVSYPCFFPRCRAIDTPVALVAPARREFWLWPAHRTPGAPPAPRRTPSIKAQGHRQRQVRPRHWRLVHRRRAPQ